MPTFNPTALALHPARAIVVTGAAGFIGSYFCGFLLRQGCEKLILVDDFSRADKAPNLAGKPFFLRIDRKDFARWAQGGQDVQAVFHLGARTDTTEMDYEVHRVLNLEYSKTVWDICTARQIPLLYASSAATYGGGEHGYSDNHAVVPKLRPLNPYGQSKQDFDLWALEQSAAPPHWIGVKFFNVYGPNEYHKGRMASVIFHAFNQVRSTGAMQLFQSHRPDFSDGGQARDFVHVGDVARICLHLLTNGAPSGLYNVGSGTARTFNDLAKAVFHGMGLPPAIRYIPTPEDIRDKYQYFTQADLTKLRGAGYDASLRSLEEGITSYVRDYLSAGAYF